MTLKQKIENLTWADLVKKLKEILTNFNSKFEGITGRISVLESSSGGGVSTGVESVTGDIVDNTNSMNPIIDVPTFQQVVNKGSTSNQQITFTSPFSVLDILSLGQSGVRLNSKEQTFGLQRNNDDYFTLESNTIGNTGQNILDFKRTDSGIATYSLPLNKIGNYTLATIENFGSLIPTYADNSAAVTGGLAVGHLYKTATGEIRVRV